jgi:hypothetical protein
MSFFRNPTGSPFCGVCGMVYPGHYPDCPVLTQEPQREDWDGPFVRSVQQLVGELEGLRQRTPQEEQLLADLQAALADYFKARDEIA